MSLEFLSNPAVIWFFIGLVLLLLEMALPGLIVVFFGVGAWVTALITAIFHPGINTQIIIFVITSVILLFLLRKYLKHNFFDKNKNMQDDLDEEFIGRFAIAEADFEKDAEGKVTFNGTLWSAIAESEIKKGEKVKIVGRENITFKIKSTKN